MYLSAAVSAVLFHLFLLLTAFNLKQYLIKTIKNANHLYTVRLLRAKTKGEGVVFFPFYLPSKKRSSLLASLTDDADWLPVS